MKSYYEILEVSPNASGEVIEKAYKTLAKKYHPDVQSDFQSDYKFRRIQEAYEILSDYDKREKYDIYLKEENAQKKTKREHQKEQDNVKVFSFGSITSSYYKTIKQLISNQKYKTSLERKNDFKAIAITIVVMGIVILVCLKVPFISKFLKIK